MPTYSSTHFGPYDHIELHYRSDLHSLTISVLGELHTSFFFPSEAAYEVFLNGVLSTINSADQSIKIALDSTSAPLMGRP